MAEFRSTDVDTRWLVARLVEQIDLVYTGCLVGGAAQTITSRFELMSSLPATVGDLVLVGSVHPNTDPMDRLGWLEKVEDIPWPGDWAHATPARRTSANASGSWPTPKASAAGPDFAKLSRSKTGISLQTAVALYPTPRSTDGDRGGRGDLIQAVRGNPNSHYRMWQTPVADDAVDRAKGKVNSRGELKLSAQVKKWPTPHGFSKDGRSNGPSGNELGRAVNEEATASDGGSLNPDWVEWLMGWPIGWTDCAAWATDKFRPWLLSHGER